MPDTATLRSKPFIPAAAQPRKIQATIPHKLGFLLDMHRYKVIYGGRAGMKTRSVAIALLVLGVHQRLRILCAREIMNSIRESVYQELKLAVESMDLGSFYTFTENGIKGANGTEFMFAGLRGHSVESLKSYANIDVCWVEEAQHVTKHSWDILVPTIRAVNSEIWVTFNPVLQTNETWKRFIVQKQPDSVVVKTTYRDNLWFPKVLEADRLHMKESDPAGYDNVWEGNPLKAIAGAIYHREVLALIEEERYRATPYDPRFPVHAIWDIGWNDSMALVMAQKVSPTVLHIINYLEVTQYRYDEVVAVLERLRYRWSFDWLPHDGANHNPISGTNAYKELTRLKRMVHPKGVPKSDATARAQAGRQMMPRIYIDNSKNREIFGGYLGCERLMECLQNYRRHIPLTTNEPTTPVHDAYSHGADAFGGLGQIVDQISGDFEVDTFNYQVVDPAPTGVTGMLG